MIISQNQGMLLQCLNQYYQLQAKLPAGLDYFDQPNAQEDVFQRFLGLMQNVDILFKNIKKLKEEMHLPIFHFTDYSDPSGHFLIQDGMFYGYRMKAINHSTTMMYSCEGKFFESAENLEMYEKSQFIYNIAMLVQSEFIPFPEKALENVPQSYVAEAMEQKPDELNLPVDKVSNDSFEEKVTHTETQESSGMVERFESSGFVPCADEEVVDPFVENQPGQQVAPPEAIHTREEKSETVENSAGSNTFSAFNAFTGFNLAFSQN